MGTISGKKKKYTIGQRIASQLYCRQAGIDKKYWRNYIKFTLSQEPCDWLPKEIDRAIARIRRIGR